MKHVSIYPKAGRNVWYAAYPDPKTGKRIFRATEFRRDDPQGRRKAWNWVRTLAVEGTLAKQEQGQSAWGCWVEPWLKMKYRTRAATLTNSLNWWSWLFIFLKDQKINSPRALDRSAVMRYPDWRMTLVKRSGKSAGFNMALQEIKLLGRIMDEAMERGFAEKNPCRKLGLKKDPAPEKPEITDAEISIIRARLKKLEEGMPLTLRWRSIAFEVALHTGCRHAETAVPFERIDWERNTMQFLAKRGKFYTIPIHPGLRPLLDQLRASGATSTCILPPKRVSSQAWSRFFHGHWREKKPQDLAHLCFHCTRVTVVTRFAREGVPIQQAMAYVHHASALIHRIYQRLRPADVHSCIAALRYTPPNF